MSLLIIKKKTHTAMFQYCDTKLVEYVFNIFSRNNGEINVDTNNSCEDIWYIEDNMLAQSEEKIEIMKVFSTFGHLGGLFMYQSRKFFFEGLVINFPSEEGNMLNLCWANHHCNQTTPTFVLGQLEIPDKMPPFVCTQTGDKYLIERLSKGEYIPLIGELYMSKEEAEERLKELTETYFAC